MATPKINGSLGPILKPTRVSYDPVRGLAVHLDYETAGAGVSGIATACIANNQAFEMEIGHRSRLSTTATGGGSGFPDTVTDHWQLMANEIQKDIKEHPNTLAMEAASTGSLALVLAAVDAFNSGDTSTPTFPGAAEPLATGLFEYMKRGGTHYALGQYVLKWTTNVSFNSTVFRGEGNRELLYSTSQVLSEAGPPLGIADAMTSISSGSPVSGYTWSWRRLPSTRTTQANNRIEIATEYWFDQWSTFAYSLA